MANIYKGFSTVGKVRAPYTLIDGDLIKQDLMNELKARKGERVMRPNFGTTLYDILMNPLDKYVVEEIKEDIERIVSKDPRVEFQFGIGGDDKMNSSSWILKGYFERQRKLLGI